jgi:hypothetical protein
MCFVLVLAVVVQVARLRLVLRLIQDLAAVEERTRFSGSPRAHLQEL